MIGDKASDVECGHHASTSTIIVLTGEGYGPRGGWGLNTTEPDTIQQDLEHAARCIIRNERTKHDASCKTLQLSCRETD
jgi:hypothetical protein